MPDNFDLGGYIQVPERVDSFYEQYPDGRIFSSPPVVVMIESGNLHQTYVQVTTTVWRSPDDPTPCQASAWELFPGKTPYTKESEMMNAETSAIGRALFAAGIEAKRGAASREDVQKAQAARNEPEAPPDPEALAKRERYNDLMAKAKKITTFPDHETYVTRLKERAKEDGIEQFSVWSNPSLHDHLDEAEELVDTYLSILQEVADQDAAAEAPQDKPKRTRAKPGSAVKDAQDRVEAAFPGAEEAPE